MCTRHSLGLRSLLFNFYRVYGKCDRIFSYIFKKYIEFVVELQQTVALMLSHIQSWWFHNVLGMYTYQQCRRAREIVPRDDVRSYYVVRCCDDALILSIHSIQYVVFLLRLLCYVHLYRKKKTSQAFFVIKPTDIRLLFKSD